MMYEYITKFFNLVHGNKMSFFNKRKDDKEFKKLRKNIKDTNVISNYDLLLDLSNVLQVLISMYGYEEMIGLLKPILSQYQYSELSNVLTRHSLSGSIQNDNCKYSIDISYQTMKNPKDDTKTTIGYYIQIYDDSFKITKGYSLSSDNAYKHKELDTLITTIMRMIIENIIIKIRETELIAL